jgi:hypothetical protein
MAVVEALGSYCLLAAFTGCGVTIAIASKLYGYNVTTKENRKEIVNTSISLEFKDVVSDRRWFRPKVLAEYSAKTA